MPSEQEEFQDVVGWVSPETPEEKLLKAIFGSSSHEAKVPARREIEAGIDLTAAIHSGALSGVAAAAVAALARKWITHHLPAAEIEEISTLASAVIGDKSKATQWLSEPNVATDNRPPIDLIGEKDGYERVRNLLLRIEYGVLA